MLATGECVRLASNDSDGEPPDRTVRLQASTPPDLDSKSGNLFAAGEMARIAKDLKGDQGRAKASLQNVCLSAFTLKADRSERECAERIQHKCRAFL
jgi:hypothetical protein